MPTLPNWTLSQESRSRMNELLKTASELGLDPDAVAAGGLAALQTLMALKRAKALAANASFYKPGRRRIGLTLPPTLTSCGKSKLTSLRFKGATATPRLHI